MCGYDFVIVDGEFNGIILVNVKYGDGQQGNNDEGVNQIFFVGIVDGDVIGNI